MTEDIWYAELGVMVKVLDEFELTETFPKGLIMPPLLADEVMV
jgi:hypothetical protein